MSDSMGPQRWRKHAFQRSIGSGRALSATCSAVALMLVATSAFAQAPSEDKQPEAVVSEPARPTTEPAAEPASTDGRPAEKAETEDRPPVDAAPPALAPTPASAIVEPTAKPQPIPEVDVVLAETRRLLAASTPKVRLTPGDRTAMTAYYNAASQPIWVSRDGLSKRGASVLAEIARADDWGLEAAAFDLPTIPKAGATTDELAGAELQISRAVLLYARHARGGRVDPSTISAIIDMRPRFVESATVLASIATAADSGGYLTGLHPRHDGFQRLRRALVDVRRGKQLEPAPDARVDDDRSGRRKDGPKSAAKPASRADTEQRIIVNMERWRWMPENLGAFHVFDNVPEQVTRVYRDGRVVLSEKIVVGKTITPTPTFSADMKYVIFHPTWGVPEGIKTNELAPMLRRVGNSGGGGWFFGGNEGGGASRALARHQLKVSYNGRDINPDSVNWSSVDVRQFQFTQPPGARNVLGIVKFRFPNRHDVYMHDTPEKHLFSQSTRAFSHGCMRVQNPMRLAEVILGYDKGWSADRVQGLLGRPGPIDITLEKSIPVHVAYFTASVDDQGQLRTHGDLYGMDQRVASVMAGRQVTLASAKTVATEPPPARREAKQPTKPRSKKEPASSEGFNPFAFLSN